jgi:ketosteroid isomerase-like protein
MGLPDDEQQITALFEAGDRALMRADIAALSQIFGDDYVQYDASGKTFSKREVLENLRTSAVRYPSIVSTGRRIRLFGDMAIVHGSESDEVEADGKRFTVGYLYMDVVLKREGRWQIVGSQLVRPASKALTTRDTKVPRRQLRDNATR